MKYLAGKYDSIVIDIQIYNINKDSIIEKEVRLYGQSNGDIPRPNVKYPNYNVNPKNGKNILMIIIIDLLGRMKYPVIMLRSDILYVIF